MSKKVKDNKRECVSSYKTGNKNISVLDIGCAEAVTSQSTVSAKTNLISTQISKKFSVEKQNTPNLVKALIQIMYDRGEINTATYEKAMKKLKREVERNERTR